MVSQKFALPLALLAATAIANPVPQEWQDWNEKCQSQSWGDWSGGESLSPSAAAISTTSKTSAASHPSSTSHAAGSSVSPASGNSGTWPAASSHATSAGSTKGAGSSTHPTTSTKAPSVSTTTTSSIDWVNKYTATGASDVRAAQATAKSSSPTSHVPGKAFDRFVVIWLENTDYNMAIGDPNLAYLASKGITLSNYFGVTHPSEPNYVASVSGDNYGME